MPLVALLPSGVKDSQLLRAPWCEDFFGRPKDFNIPSDLRIRSFDPRVLPPKITLRKAPRCSAKLLYKSVREGLKSDADLFDPVNAGDDRARNHLHDGATSFGESPDKVLLRICCCLSGPELIQIFATLCWPGFEKR